MCTTITTLQRDDGRARDLQEAREPVRMSRERARSSSADRGERAPRRPAAAQAPPPQASPPPPPPPHIRRISPTCRCPSSLQFALPSSATSTPAVRAECTHDATGAAVTLRLLALLTSPSGDTGESRDRGTHRDGRVRLRWGGHAVPGRQGAASEPGSLCTRLTFARAIALRGRASLAERLPLRCARAAQEGSED
jgi:hypothetical protein